MSPGSEPTRTVSTRRSRSSGSSAGRTVSLSTILPRSRCCATSSRRWRERSGLDGRPDEELLTGRLSRIGLQGMEVQRAGQRDLIGVVTCEGGPEFRHHSRAEPDDSVESDLAEERSQQPTADAPSHAEVAGELGGAAIEAAVDVDL